MEAGGGAVAALLPFRGASSCCALIVRCVSGMKGLSFAFVYTGAALLLLIPAASKVRLSLYTGYAPYPGALASHLRDSPVAS